MRKSGSKHQRNIVNPNIRQQDGIKEYLLCQDCETLFSGFETYFANNIFHPHLKNGILRFDYTENLMKFLISVLWRVLIKDRSINPRGQCNFLELLEAAEKKWRSYLLGKGNLNNFEKVHLFITDLSKENEQPVLNLNLYFTRAVDGTVLTSETDCLVFAKFSRFIIFSGITEIDESLWVNTKINKSDGVISVGNQEIQDGYIGNFLVDRARMLNQELVSGLSENQKRLIHKTAHNDLERLEKSDLIKAMLADSDAVITPTICQPKKKIGRNELCPCGSGRKYKRCHGA